MMSGASRQVTSNRREGRAFGQVRGFAMLLVIISLAVVTVTMTAFVAGRAARPEISENVARGVCARAAAETGLDFAISVIKNESIDWRTKLVETGFITDYVFGKAKVDVQVCDLDGQPPTADTREILIIAEGRDTGVRQVVAARATVPARTPGADIDLSEFAVFADQSLIITNSDLVRWTQSPTQEVKRPIKIGTNSLDSGAIRLNLGTRITDGAYYVRRNAPLLSLMDLSGSLRPPKRMPISETDPIPIVVRCVPDTTGFIISSPYDRMVSTGTWLVPESKQFGSVTATNDAIILMDTPGVTMHVTGDLNLINGGDLVVRASVTLVIEGSLNISSFSAIDIADDVKLKIFLGGNLDVNDGIVGLPEALAWDARRSPADSLDRYYNPKRCSIQTIPGSPPATWRIRNKGFVCARIGAPGTRLRMEQQSALYGNVAASDIEIKDASVIHYDCSLDTGTGYTQPDSLLYMDDGSFDANLYSVTSGQCVNQAEINAIRDYIINIASKDDTRASWKNVEFEIIQLGFEGDRKVAFKDVIEELTAQVVQ